MHQARELQQRDRMLPRYKQIDVARQSSFFPSYRSKDPKAINPRLAANLEELHSVRFNDLLDPLPVTQLDRLNRGYIVETGLASRAHPRAPAAHTPRVEAAETPC